MALLDLRYAPPRDRFSCARSALKKLSVHFEFVGREGYLLKDGTVSDGLIRAVESGCKSEIESEMALISVFDCDNAAVVAGRKADAYQMAAKVEPAVLRVVVAPTRKNYLLGVGRQAGAIRVVLSNRCASG